MSKLLEMLKGMCEARGWTHQMIEKPRALEVVIDRGPVQWKSYGQGKEDDDIFVYYSLSPENAPPERRHAVAAYITHVSFQLLVGGFEMSWESGEVRFKQGLELRGEPMTPELMQGVIHASHQAMLDYLPNLLKVIRGEQEAPEAYAEAIA